MTTLVRTLRAIIRDELARVRLPELGTVTRVLARASDDAADNHQVNVKLRATGVELERVAVAVARLGLSALPNEGDLVLVAFAGGDLNLPVVIGCVYDDQAHPPVAQAHEVVYQPPDEADSSLRRLHIELTSGTTLTLQDEIATVVLGDTSIEVNKDGDVVVKAKGKLSLQAEGDVEVKAGGDLLLSAQGQASLKGMSASLEGQSEAKLKGAQIAIAGMTQFNPS